MSEDWTCYCDSLFYWSFVLIGHLRYAIYHVETAYSIKRIALYKREIQTALNWTTATKYSLEAEIWLILDKYYQYTCVEYFLRLNSWKMS